MNQVRHFVIAAVVLAITAVDANASSACRIRKAAWAAQYGDTLALAQLAGAVTSAVPDRLFVVNAAGVADVGPKPEQQAVPAPAKGDEVVQPKKWVLDGGKSIRVQVSEWAVSADWRLNWRLDVDWIVPATITYEGEFDKALASVVEALYAQGKPVRLKLWAGNRVAEVISNDVK